MAKPFLTKDDARRLVQLHARTKKRNEADRIKSLLLLDKGWTYAAIKEALLLDESTVRRYRDIYLDGGIDAVLKTGFLGGKCRLTDMQKDQLYQHLCAVTYTESADIRAYVEQTFHVRYSISGIKALLYSIGMSYKKPKLVPAKACMQDQLDFIEKYEQEQKKGSVIYWMDGTHPTHNSMPAYGWIPKGVDIELKSNSGRDRININGAINAETMEGVFDFTHSVDAHSTIGILEAIAEKHHNDECVWIICDNARYYRSGLVQDWLENQNTIQLVFLPPYSPNLNLIERLWKFFKKKTMYNTYHETIDDFRNAVHAFFRRLKDFKPELKRLLSGNFQLFGG